LERQRANDEFFIDLRELVVRMILSFIPVVDLQRTVIWKMSGKLLKITSSFWIAPVVGAGKTEGILALITLNWVVNYWLTGKRKEINTVMTKGGFVSVNTIQIRGKHKIE